MIKSKAIDLLKSFTKKEFQHFEYFLYSPFHNTNNRIVQAFKFLKKYYPLFNSGSICYENLFRLIFKGKIYNEALVRNILSDLLKAVEQFTAHYELQNDIRELTRLTNKVLVKKNLYNHFKKKNKSALNMLDNNSKKNEEYFYYKYIYLKQNMTIKRQNEHEYSDTSEDFTNTERALTEYISVHLGSFYTNYTTFDFVPMEKLNPALYKHTLSILSDQEISIHPVIKIYNLFHQLYSTGQDEFYYKFKNHLNEYESLFEYEEIQNFYIPIHNFVLNKINSGFVEYLREYQEIILLFIEKGFCRNQDGTISQPFFRNAVMVNVKLKQFNDAKAFVEKFHNDLLPGSAENNYFYSMSYIYFYEKNYRESLNNLLKIKFDEYLLKMQTESLALQNYYELNMFEESYHKIDAFEHYIHNNKKIPDNYLALYSNFLVFLKKILKMKDNSSSGMPQLLRSEIQKNQPASKSWLLEKIEEIEYKRRILLSAF